MFKRTYDQYDRMMKRLDPRLPNIIMFLLAGLLIVYGVFLFNYRLDAEMTKYQFIYSISGLQIVAAGQIIIIDPRRNYVRTVILFAISLGTFRFVSYLMMFFQNIHNMSSLVPYEIVLAFIYLVLSIIGLMMFVTAAAIQIGFAFRRNSLLVSCMIGVASQFGRMLLISLYNGVGGDDSLVALLQDTMFQRVLLEFIIFIFVIYVFDSEGVRNGSTWGKHSKYIQVIRNGRVSDLNSYIEPEAVGALVDPTLTEWRTMMDCGPVEKEYSFIVHGKNQVVSSVIVQRWKGDPRYHMTLQGSLKTTVLHANRIMVDSIYLSDKRIHFAGKDGTDVSFAVRYGGPDDLFGYEGADV